MSAECEFTPWPEAAADYYRKAGYWRGETLWRMLENASHQYAAHTALVDEKRRLSYSELRDEAEQLARGFHQLGIGAADNVVLQLPNCCEFFTVFFALMRLGAKPVLALPAHRQVEIGFFCQHTQAKAYVIAGQHTGFNYQKLANDVQAESPALREVIVVGETENFTAFDRLKLAKGKLPEEPCDASAVAFYQLSGGSTGTPKLIPRTHDDYLYSVRRSAEICGLQENSAYLCVLPCGHNFPLSSAGSLGIFTRGGKVVLAPHGNPEEAFRLIAEEAITLTALVPPLLAVWLNAAEKDASQLASLQLVQAGGAKLSSHLAAKVKPLLGCRLQQVFGMAEGLVNYTRLDDSDDVILHTQGRPMCADDEILLLDDDDQPVQSGEVGHLLTRGPYTIRGYYRSDAHNHKTFTADGFYRTGDKARLTTDGNLIVEGRAKDQINRGGEKIAAEEVEHYLLAHPAIHDAALVAIADDYLGERACACLVASPGSSELRLIDIKRFLRDSGLAEYKLPDQIRYYPELPKTSVGKISKKTLRQWLATAAV